MSRHEDLHSRLPAAADGDDRTFALPRGGTAAAAGFDGELIGRRLGRYVVVNHIGRGGMGMVVLARDTELRRDVALKVLPATLALSPDLRARFRREARAMARVDHPRVVQVFDVVEEDGVVGLAMELVEGCTLADVIGTLREARDSGTPIDVFGALEARGISVDAATRRAGEAAWVAGLGAALADGLQAVHDVGVLHRDIKPSNVLIDRAGRPRLADFGVAVDPDATVVTHGNVCGTAPYSSPEQLRADPELDARVDIYGLGATLYELLALQPPATGAAGTVLHAVESGRVPRLDRSRLGLPRDLVTVVHRAIDPQRTGRFPSAVELGDDLRAVRDGRPIRSRRVSRPERALRWARREPARAVTGLVAVLSMLAVLVVVLHQREVQAAERRREQTMRAVHHDIAESLLLSSGPPTWDVAQAPLRRAMERDPTSPEAALANALLLHRMGRADEADRFLASSAALRGLPRGEELPALLQDALALSSDDLRSLPIDESSWLQCFIKGHVCLLRALPIRDTRLPQEARQFLELASNYLTDASSSELLQQEWLMATERLLKHSPQRSTATFEARSHLHRRRYADSWVAQLVVARMLREYDAETSLECCEQARRLGAPTALVDRVEIGVVECTDGLEAARDLGERRLEERAAAGLVVPSLLNRVALTYARLMKRAHDRGEDPSASAERREELLVEARRLFEQEIAGRSEREIPVGLRRLHLDVLEQLRAWDDVLRAHRRSTDAYPEWSRAWHDRGRATAKAVEHRANELRRAAARAPRREPLHDADELAALEARIDDACRCFERALELDPSHHACLHDYARFLIVGLTDHAAGLPLLRKVLENEGDAPDNWALLAMVYRNLGRWDEAVDATEQAMRRAAALLDTSAKYPYERGRILVQRVLHEWPEDGLDEPEVVEELRRAQRFLGTAADAEGDDALRGRDAPNCEALRLALDVFLAGDTAAERQRVLERARAWGADQRGVVRASNIARIAVGRALAFAGDRRAALRVLQLGRLCTQRFARFEPVPARRQTIDDELAILDEQIARLR